MSSEPATVRPGYTLPQRNPAVCPMCNEAYSPLAYCDEEGIGLSGFCCACDGVEDEDLEHEWPFLEDEASIADFEAIGFWVVNV